MRLPLIPFGMAFLLSFPPSAAAQNQAREIYLSSTTSPAASSRAIGVLTLVSAVEMAYARNPGLRAAQLEVQVAAGARQQAGVIRNPELSYLSEGTQSGRRTTTTQVNLPIELGGKRGARVQVANAAQDIATAELKNFRSDLYANVVAAFFDVLTAQERLELAEASRQLSVRVTDVASRRVAAGKISPVEETRARVAESSSKIELSQAQNELALAKRHLASTWGGRSPEFDRVEAPEGNAEQNVHMGDEVSHLSQSPQVTRARLEVLRQGALIGMERSKRIPDLTVSLGTKRDEQLGVRQTVVGLAIPLPFFDRNQGNLLSALRRSEKATAELSAIENQVSLELNQAILRRTASKSELAILKTDILPGAQSAYESATKGFELGKFNFLDVLDAQRTLFQAKTQYVRALTEFYRSNAEIERLIGHTDTAAAHASAP